MSKRGSMHDDVLLQFANFPPSLQFSPFWINSSMFVDDSPLPKSFRSRLAMGRSGRGWGPRRYGVGCFKFAAHSRSRSRGNLRGWPHQDCGGPMGHGSPEQLQGGSPQRLRRPSHRQCSGRNQTRRRPMQVLHKRGGHIFQKAQLASYQIVRKEVERKECNLFFILF